MAIDKRAHRLTPLIGALIFALIVVAFAFNLAQAQDQCKTELAEAEGKYRDGFFDEAISLLLGCLNKSGLTAAESEQAYLLLAKAYHANQLLKESKEALSKLLNLVPDWKPNPDTDTPPFQELAQEVIKELEQKRQQEKAVQKTPPTKLPEPVPTAKKGGGKKWLWIGAGGLVAGGVAALLLKGDSTSEPPPAGGFPEPPGRPR